MILLQVSVVAVAHLSPAALFVDNRGTNGQKLYKCGTGSSFSSLLAFALSFTFVVAFAVGVEWNLPPLAFAFALALTLSFSFVFNAIYVHRRGISCVCLDHTSFCLHRQAAKDRLLIPSL